MGRRLSRPDLLCRVGGGGVFGLPGRAFAEVRIENHGQDLCCFLRQLLTLLLLFLRWCPDHRPVLTAVEVKSLALEGMRIEVEVEAYDAE